MARTGRCARQATRPARPTGQPGRPTGPAPASVRLGRGLPPLLPDQCFLARIDDIDALVVPEIRPLYGTLAAFRRTGNSFHGHLPYEGERPVVQVAWLTSEAEKSRKTRRGRSSRMVKKLIGRLDRWFGASRDRNASHHD